MEYILGYAKKTVCWAIVLGDDRPKVSLITEKLLTHLLKNFVISDYIESFEKLYSCVQKSCNDNKKSVAILSLIIVFDTKRTRRRNIEN